MKKDPFQPVDDDARALLADLLKTARTAALGVIDPTTGSPHVSRISFATGPDGQPLSLMSTLAFHTRALMENPACSLLIGEPPTKGDPMAFARVTLSATAAFLSRDEAKTLRAHYLARHPKAKLYIDFADFRIVRFMPGAGALNGGFGKAFRFTARDLA